jgi:hypothetical protein
LVRRGIPEAAFVRALALLLASTALLLASARPVAAQDARVEVDPAPYHRGQPIALQIVATQFEEEPTPEVEFDPQEGLSIRFLGVSPSTSTSITIINGQMSRVHEVSFVYRYELSSARVGRVEVPEFRVRQGATLRRTRPFALEIAAVPTSEEFGIAVVLPPGPIFVGQKVPVEIELRIDEAVLQDYLNYRVQVPLFDAPGLRFLDTSPVRSNTQLEITTATGVIRLPAVSEERNIGGRSNLVLRAERTLVAQKPGLIRADAPTVTIERGTGFRRDLFGQRQATGARRSVSAGRAIRLEVAEVPAAGRPASFAGAVGSGFSLEVEADRSVVQLGEPIALTFHLRGQGDLSSAGLPPLSAEGLFDPALFRLPEEAPAGLIDEDGKHFEVTLRVLDAGVREIPALAYSWFDAETRRFETVHSEPIALAVGAAQVVGAESVASRVGDESTAGASGASAGAAGSAGEGASRAASAATGADATAGARRSSLAESAANLALERDPEILLRAARAERGTGFATLSLYGVGLALLGFGLLDRRRRAVDPRVRERIAALVAAKVAIEAAAAPGQADGAGALGRALRELVAAFPDESTASLDALLAECDALRFAPGAGGGAGAALPASLAERARQWIEARRAAVAGAR